MRRCLLPVVLVLAAASLGGGAAHAAGSSEACATATLVVWLDTQPDHAAGSAYYRLELTNLSARACTLRGYPGVSAVTLAGRQLGSAAGRNPAHPVRTVTLAPGATASAVLQIADALNFPASACKPGTAAGLRVYPPGQRRARIVPFPFPACTRGGPVYLHVEAVA
jgi:hypothetical protein